MPKKQQNAFYFFMKSEEPNLRREGRVFPNGMADMVAICHPRWKTLPQKDKDRFENMAKEFKAKMRGKQGDKYLLDNQGESVAGRTNKYKDLEKRRMQEKKLIRKNWPAGTGVIDEKFYFVSFQVLCRTEEGHYLPCEIALIEYSIAKGITKHLHRFIEPGKIPTGYRFACIEHSQDTHQIPVENFEQAYCNYLGLWNQIENFINPNGEKQEYPPLYCLGAGENYILVEYCLDWILAHSRTGIPNRIKHVFEVESLLQELLAHVGKSASKSACIASLDTSDYDYEPNTKCDYHEKLEVKHCALGIVNRFAYCFSDGLKEPYDIELTENHIPMRRDLAPMTVLPPSTMPVYRNQGLPPQTNISRQKPQIKEEKAMFKKEEQYSDMRRPREPGHYGSGDPAGNYAWGGALGGVSHNDFPPMGRGGALGGVSHNDFPPMGRGGATGGVPHNDFPPIGRGSAMQYNNDFSATERDDKGAFNNYQAPMPMGRGISPAFQGMTFSEKHAGKAGPPPATAAPDPPRSWKQQSVNVGFQQPIGVGRGMMSMNQSDGKMPPGYNTPSLVGYTNRNGLEVTEDHYAPLRLPGQNSQELHTQIQDDKQIDKAVKPQIGQSSGIGYGGGILERLLKDGVRPGRVSIGRGYAPADWDDGSLGPVRR